MMTGAEQHRSPQSSPVRSGVNSWQWWPDGTSTKLGENGSIIDRSFTVKLKRGDVQVACVVGIVEAAGRQHQEGAFRVVADGRTRGRSAPGGDGSLASSSLALGGGRTGRCMRLLRVLKRQATSFGLRLDPKIFEF